MVASYSQLFFKKRVISFCTLCVCCCVVLLLFFSVEESVKLRRDSAMDDLLFTLDLLLRYPS
ncbi:hypothetical protein GLYMA_03G049500v4 [Glycine max]|uniref:Uncharacterized protein n=1 Tax=Glycine max TaxID=3847 RepID=A0A0R0KK57_SOYBN|nr:hypothetical protein GLYMA_03G049500v4 [Glycine max]